MSRVQPLSCRGCGHILPPHVALEDCAVCALLSLEYQAAAPRCLCRPAILDRRYLGTWLCRRCSQPIDGAD